VIGDEMPEVKQLDWEKLQPKQPENRSTHAPMESIGTKQFNKYQFKESRKGSKNGSVKTTTRAIDPSIGDYHDNALKGFYKNL
jgi:hypothetical protein